MSYKYNKLWRERHPKLRYCGKKKYCQRNAVNRKNSGSHWTIEEERLVLSEGRPCDRVLARELGRSIQAIQIKRSKLVR